MAFTIVPCRRSDIEAVRALLLDPSLQGEFSMLTLPGVLEDSWEDPLADFDLRWLALADGAPAGYLYTLVLPSTPKPWALIRLGVIGPHRRRGLGSALLETCIARLAQQGEARGIGEICTTAWLPSESAAGFVTRHGFRHARFFWKMERPPGNPPEPAWPAGIEVRVFDGGEPALRDFVDAYNDSFAAHYHFVVLDMEQARVVTRQRTFRPEGLVMAYRGGRCVGYCRNTIRGREGEIAVLGVVGAARGIGLGRALLRWSAAWLEREGCEPIELHVDGENETALALYRSEGFAVTRTREFWSRA